MNFKTIPFSKYFGLGALVSTLAVSLSLLLIVSQGLNYGVDFSGGTEIQVQFQSGDVTSKSLTEAVSNLGLEKPTVQTFSDDNEFLVRFQNPKGSSEKETNQLLNGQILKVKDTLKAQFQAQAPEVRRVDSVGPAIGEELRFKGLLAAFYSLVLILIYISLRFDFKYAPGAVIALFHDSVIVLGALTLLGREINVQTVAAILTIIGYSLNDTIVCFDRVRENEAIDKKGDFKGLIDRSLSEVLSRTVFTSLTTLFALVAIFVFARGSLADFALALIIGVIVGTYSSLFVANPILLLMDKFLNKRAALKTLNA